jgi:SAM-dependent methyltransferase
VTCILGNFTLTANAHSGEFERLTGCVACGSRSIETLDSDAALSVCRGCGYIFDNPRPTLEALVDFYSRATKYDSWLSEEGPRDKLWARRLKKMCRTARPGNLLDIGAGIGQLLHLARHEYTEVSGTEVSSSAVEIARRKYGIQLHHGTLETLPVQPKSFDNITLFHVLEHVPNPRLMIEKCVSLLRGSGVLVIAVPRDYQPTKCRIRRILGGLGLRRYRGASRSGLKRIQLDGSRGEIHLSHFTPKVLRQLLESCGLTVIEESVDPWRVPRDGVEGIKQDLKYWAALTVLAVSRTNVYDSVWMVGQKQI